MRLDAAGLPTLSGSDARAALIVSAHWSSTNAAHVGLCDIIFDEPQQGV